MFLPAGRLLNSCAGAPLPSNDGKKWAPEEVEDLIRLVEDDDFRRERLNLEKVGCCANAGSVECVRWFRVLR